MAESEDTKSTPTDDYDSPWKEVSGKFFPQLVEFFAPDLHKVIDWSAGYEFLEQELREMLRDAETGPRRVDKVVKVRTLAGKPLYLVLHVEIQVSRESGFPLRMFVYYYRLFDLYPEQVVSLAILADEEPDWRPESYEHALHGTQLDFGYRTVKISEYNERWTELERDPNPFALVVMAHLKTKATRGNATERLIWKVKLVRDLYERGYDREHVLELFRFIDWLLALPNELMKSFRQRIEEIEQESKMQYVTSIERQGRREGRQEGRQEGLRQVVLTQLEEKFGPPDASVLSRIEKASPEQILLWAKKILTASSQDEIFAT
ncbi:MAG: hypothetical protein AAF560_15405 [Acidobacteriota bacterium]